MEPEDPFALTRAASRAVYEQRPAVSAALDFADRFACDHLSIDDGVRETLRAHFDEAEIVELGMRCAIFVGFGRFAATLNLVDHLPDSFRARDGGVVTPWGHDSVLTTPGH